MEKLIIKLIYKVKLDDIVSDFVEGTKKGLPTVCMIMFAFTVLVCAYNNGLIETVIAASKEFNIALTVFILYPHQFHATYYLLP